MSKIVYNTLPDFKKGKGGILNHAKEVIDLLFNLKITDPKRYKSWKAWLKEHKISLTSNSSFNKQGSFNGLNHPGFNSFNKNQD